MPGRVALAYSGGEGCCWWHCPEAGGTGISRCKKSNRTRRDLERSRGFGDFMLGPQASGAQVESLWLPVYIYRNRVNVRHPATLGVAFGVADIMTKLG